MSYVVGDLVDYANLQTDIQNVFQFLPPTELAQDVPMLRWLYSDANRGNIEMAVSPGRGKIRTVEINWMQDIADSSVESDVSNPTCATGSVVPDHYQRYEIDTTDNLSHKFTITRLDLESAVQDNAEYVTRVINKLMLAIERAVASRTSTEALTLVGEWHDDVESAYTVSSDFLVLKTLKDSDATTLQPFTMEDLTMALQMTGYAQPPAMFGGIKLAQYVRRMAGGAVGDHGTDLSKMMAMYGVGAAYDHFMKDAFNNQTDSIVLHPGAAQLLTYTAAPWRDGAPYVINSSDYSQVTLFTPRVGLPVDLIITDNCGTITFRVIATTKLVGPPADYFNASNGHAGVTMINKVRITNV